ncbi:MAG TPA: STAS/SEC14 domain-containing protein [Patescibacteria group bacterium]|nr:STAS/SEC14 domain-containing protein [Patescibacteria group bacterium]
MKRKTIVKDKPSVRVLPQTDDQTLCVEMSGLIRAEDHKRAFYDNLEKIIAKNGFYDLLIVHAPDFKGWEAGAADQSLRTIMELAKYGRRRAMVNPPEKIVLMQKVSGDKLFGGETRYFNVDQFDEALAWVKSSARKVKKAPKRSRKRTK